MNQPSPSLEHLAIIAAAASAALDARVRILGVAEVPTSVPLRERTARPTFLFNRDPRTRRSGVGRPSASISPPPRAEPPKDHP